MNKAKKVLLSIVFLAVLLGTLTALILFYFPHHKPLRLQGAVLIEDADPRKRLPIPDVNITVITDAGDVTAKSDSSGFFTLQLPVSIRRGRAITLQFAHHGYRPAQVHDYVADKLYVAQMALLASAKAPPAHTPAITVANLRVRYSIKAMTAVNIGSAVQTFEVNNAGNVPCKGQEPCSPDGVWKAAIAGTSLDAGTGNEFRNARVSCIAGPCPFTRIEHDGFSKGGQQISVSARDWSDTATFLLEAEVFHPMVSDVVHELHPVIFGRALNFTLPAAAEGVCLKADVAGESIIYPLGPALYLSWANCDASGNRNQTKVYRCELKPEYQFPAASGDGAPTK
jgi:hypothetical protein